MSLCASRLLGQLEELPAEDERAADAAAKKGPHPHRLGEHGHRLLSEAGRDLQAYRDSAASSGETGNELCRAHMVHRSEKDAGEMCGGRQVWRPFWERGPGGGG